MVSQNFITEGGAEAGGKIFGSFQKGKDRAMGLNQRSNQAVKGAKGIGSESWRIGDVTVTATSIFLAVCWELPFPRIVGSFTSRPWAMPLLWLVPIGIVAGDLLIFVRLEPGKPTLPQPYQDLQR